MKKIIEGRSIVKVFGKGEEKSTALNGVDVDITQGEFIAIMGASGSGKSTLLFSLSGMDNISDGSVKFCDIDLSQRNESELADLRRTRMGFVFQQPTMLRNLNLLDNIILPAMQGSKVIKCEIIQKAKKLMIETGISGLEKRDITEVSGGQLQRAGICRALINSPEILFADEPTGALNSKSANEIMELFSDINKDGTAILLVTHDPKVAARADRVLLTKDGKIISDIFLDKSSGENFDARVNIIIKQMAVIGI